MEVVLNGTSVSLPNNLHPYKVILEAGLSHEPITKEKILRTHRYYYEPDPSDNNDETDSLSFGVRRLMVDQVRKKFEFLLSTIWQLSFGHRKIHTPCS